MLGAQAALAKQAPQQLLVPPEGGLELIQVCADASDPAGAERELRALVEAERCFPEANLRLLTLTRDGAPPELPPGVSLQPAYEWMLAGPEG